MSSRESFYRPIHQSIVILFVTVAILGSLAAVFTVKWLILAVLLGVGLGTLVGPVGDFLKKSYKVPRAVTSMVFLLLFFGSFLSVGYFLGTVISGEIVPLFRKLPAFSQHLEQSFPIFGKLAQNFHIEEFLGSAPEAILSGLKIGASFVGALVFVFFVALYFSLQPDLYENGLISAFPAHLRPKARRVLAESERSLRRWFSAQLLAMLTVAVVASIGLRIAGSHYWLFFGAVVFVLELVPYFGPITAFAAVCLVTATGQPDDLIKTAIAFGLVLFLEGHVIVPLIMRGRVHLPPVLLLLLLAAMGEWFGAVGFLMAAPTLTVLRTVYQLTYLQEMNHSQKAPSEIRAIRG